MKTSMLDYVLKRLDAAKGRWPAISEGSGVPYRTLQKIGHGDTKNPGIEHVQRLHDYFANQDVAA